MRLARPHLVAGTLVLLAVVVGTTVALTTRTAPTAPPAAQAAEPPAAAPGGSPASTTPTTTDPTGTRPGAAAVATARAFLARELGMTDMVAGPFRSTGTGTGEVGFRHKYGEGRRLLPQTGPYAVVVRLQRLPAGWWVLGVQGRSIRITSPVRLQRIGSPLIVRGTATELYEGSLYFKVTQDRPGRDLLLGEGLVDGSVSTRPGDLGQLRFRQPASAAPGWVIFYDAAADGSNGIVQATMVRVRFTVPTPAPRVLAVTTSPTLRDVSGWLELPKGPGTVRFTVRASNTDRVRFVLTPTGTGMGPYGELLGEDRDARDGFTLTWNYGPGDAASAHLTV
ncbi:MAG TPA: hypothetical protein VF880_11415, partial [Actinomycetes bacterium]